jgi:uracil phosphoribosyltransferase
MYTVLDHPLVSHRVTLMRDRETPPKLFRELVGEITSYLAYEALRDVRVRQVDVETPVAKTRGEVIDEPRIILVPILRAGMGMLDAMLRVLPFAKVGVLGMQRNEDTAEPVPYYAKVPPAKDGEELALVLDPMLATGGSACDAVAQLKRLGYRRIKFLNLISAPEGIAKFEKEHPDVPVVTAAKDERLNSHFYIVPGLGDAGDRIFGTL